MSPSLRIGEASSRLGVSPETIREWVRIGHLQATRTPTNQLMFEEAAIEATRRGEGRPSSKQQSRTQNLDEVRSDDRPREPAWKQTAPWDVRVKQVRAELDVDALEFERDERAFAREKQLADRERAEEQDALRQANWQRIENLKKQTLRVLWCPVEFRATIVTALEQFATPQQVPGWLSNREQFDIVFAHASGLLDQLRADRRRAEDARLRSSMERTWSAFGQMTGELQKSIETPAFPQESLQTAHQLPSPSPSPPLPSEGLTLFTLAEARRRSRLRGNT